jgi:hypothetical protein
MVQRKTTIILSKGDLEEMVKKHLGFRDAVVTFRLASAPGGVSDLHRVEVESFMEKVTLGEVTDPTFGSSD